MSYIQLTDQGAHSWKFESDLIVEHYVESHKTSLAFYGDAHNLRDLYIAIYMMHNGHAFIVLSPGNTLTLSL